jgi:hypothetical protein
MCQSHASPTPSQPAPARRTSWTNAATLVVAVYAVVQFAAWVVARRGGCDTARPAPAVGLAGAIPTTTPPPFDPPDACAAVYDRCAQVSEAEAMPAMICARIGVRAYEETGSARTPLPGHCEAAGRALDLYAAGGPAALRGGGWRW